MPVFQCKTCERYLYRPDDLLGRAWQCPGCGPTVISDKAVSLCAELTALLEREYRLGLAPPPEVSALHCAKCGRVVYRPADLLGRAWQCPKCGPTVLTEEPVNLPAELAALRGEDEPPVQPSAAPGESEAEEEGPFKLRAIPGTRGMLVAAVGAVLFTLVFGFSHLLPQPLFNVLAVAAFVIAVGGFAVAVISIPVLLASEVERRRRLHDVHSRLNSTPSPNRVDRAEPRAAVPNVQRRPETVDPEPDANQAAHLQEKPGDGR
jgi:predicted RNA-binding Zn-ribbon protein involved in translation (DUF1610 family)